MVPIKAWPALERPREKLLSNDAGRLSDAELLAVILQTGIPGLSSVDIARQLLLTFGGLSGLAAAKRQQLAAQPGIGPSKIASLEAIQELSKRQIYEGIKHKEVLTNSARTRQYLRARFRHCEQEVFSCLFLNNQHHVVELEELFKGTIDGAAVYPREVVKRCLYHNAAAVIFAHNHPSGVAEPSQADIAITLKLKAALQTIDVRLLDHLVIGESEVVSLAERNLL
jgi:DNA repair protein RadC